MSEDILPVELVAIPAGSFWLGEGEDAHQVHLNNFQIGKFPVTAAEYQRFVNTTGHAPPGYWPAGQHHPMFGNHPVVSVSWHDALAFCSWLSQAAGQPFRLPTEAEWEKAARGPEGNIYPWGETFSKEKCNTWEAMSGRTMPVSTFPQGASQYGVMDMAGNVWEWCSSLEWDYPYAADDGRENLSDAGGWRVLRGGSWYDTGWGIRAARRLGGPAHYISHNTGFRVACGPLA